MTVLKKTLESTLPLSTVQCPIWWVGADRQAQQDSYTEIHQLYPINRANSRIINNNEARNLKCFMKQDKQLI